MGSNSCHPSHGRLSQRFSFPVTKPGACRVLPFPYSPGGWRHQGSTFFRPFLEWGLSPPTPLSDITMPVRSLTFWQLDWLSVARRRMPFFFDRVDSVLAIAALFLPAGVQGSLSSPRDGPRLVALAPLRSRLFSWLRFSLFFCFLVLSEKHCWERIPFSLACCLCLLDLHSFATSFPPPLSFQPPHPPPNVLELPPSWLRKIFSISYSLQSNRSHIECKAPSRPLSGVIFLDWPRRCSTGPTSRSLSFPQNTVFPPVFDQEKITSLDVCLDYSRFFFFLSSPPKPKVLQSLF